MKERIYLHDGSAHLDEVCATAAYLLATGKMLEDVIIERISFQEADRKAHEEHPGIFLDCGKKFDGLRFFDHHQEDPAVQGKSAYNLVVDSFKQLEFLKTHPLYERLAFQDNRGRQAYFTHLGLTCTPDQFPFEYVEKLLLGKLGRDNDYQIIQLFREYFSDYRDHLVFCENRQRVLRENGYCEDIAGLKVFFIDRFFDSETQNMCIAEVASEFNAVLTVSPDSKHPERWGVFRTVDDPAIDLYKAAFGKKGVFFVHKNGFLMVCERDKHLLCSILQSLSTDLDPEKE